MLENRWDCYDRIDARSLGDVYVAASNLPRKGWERRDIPNPETVAQHEMDAAILVVDFKEELIKIGANIDIIQDMLLVHDSGEPYMVLRDVTPHCKVNPEEKRKQEEAAIRDIF